MTLSPLKPQKPALTLSQYDPIPAEVFSLEYLDKAPRKPVDYALLSRDSLSLSPEWYL